MFLSIQSLKRGLLLGVLLFWAVASNGQLSYQWEGGDARAEWSGYDAAAQFWEDKMSEQLAADLLSFALADKGENAGEESGGVAFSADSLEEQAPTTTIDVEVIEIPYEEIPEAGKVEVPSAPEQHRAQVLRPQLTQELPSNHGLPLIQLGEAGVPSGDHVSNANNDGVMYWQANVKTYERFVYRVVKPPRPFRDDAPSGEEPVASFKGGVLEVWSDTVGATVEQASELSPKSAIVRGMENQLVQSEVFEAGVTEPLTPFEERSLLKFRGSEIQPVPEPSAVVLILLATMGALLRRAR